MEEDENCLGEGFLSIGVRGHPLSPTALRLYSHTQGEIPAGNSGRGSQRFWGWGPTDAQPQIQQPREQPRWPWTAFHEQGRLGRPLTPLPGLQASWKPSQTSQVTKCLEEKQKKYLFVLGHITSDP